MPLFRATQILSADGVTGLQESVVDYVAAALQSSNITVNYDDAAGIIQLTSPAAGVVDWDTIDATAWDALQAT